MNALRTTILGLLLASVAAAAPAHADAPHITAEAGADDSVHLRFDTAAVWGIGSQMYLGAQLHTLLQFPAWDNGDATGTFDLSLRMHYGHEAMFLGPWRTEERDQLNRFVGQIGVGTSFFMTSSRRVSLGIHVLAGWSHFNRYIVVDWPNENLFAKSHTAENRPIVSAEITLAYRFHDHVGINLTLGAPFPTDYTNMIGLAHVGLGLTFYAF